MSCGDLEPATSCKKGIEACLLGVFGKVCGGICHNDGEFSMSVFKACFEHALVNRPPVDECFSGVPGHCEGNAGLADLARVVIGAGPHIVVNASQMFARITPARLTQSD